jgi:hypothetical protein
LQRSHFHSEGHNREIRVVICEPVDKHLHCSLKSRYFSRCHAPRNVERKHYRQGPLRICSDGLEEVYSSFGAILEKPQIARAKAVDRLPLLIGDRYLEGRELRVDADDILVLTEHQGALKQDEKHRREQAKR